MDPISNPENLQCKTFNPFHEWINIICTYRALICKIIKLANSKPLNLLRDIAAPAFRIILLSGFLFLQNNAFCQSGFVVFDSTMVTGLWVVAGKNPDIIYVNKEDGSVETYTPDDITSFGVKEGRVYYSMNLEGVEGKVFVENPYVGKLTVYRYNGSGKKTFFVEKDGVMTTLQSTNYKERLKELTSDCQGISRQTRLLRFGQRRITELARRYENCDLKPFPHMRWGILAGLETTWLPVKSGYHGFFSLTSVSLRDIDLQPSTTWLAGFYVDMPIFTNEVSLNLGAYYTQNTYSQNFTYSNINIKITSLDYRILLQYTFPRNKLRPYLNWGYRLSNHLKTSSIFNAGLPTNADLISKYMGGPHLGGGLQYDIGLRQMLNIELAYSYLYTSEGYFRKTNFSFAVGLLL